VRNTAKLQLPKSVERLMRDFWFVTQMGDPLEERLRQDQDRPAAIQSLLQTITSFREAALSKDPKYDHIEAADKEKVRLADLFRTPCLAEPSVFPVLSSCCDSFRAYCHGVQILSRQKKGTQWLKGGSRVTGRETMRVND
jgi:hypothetical protein